ncbi:uncharacterized protein LOC132791027 isoform X1 [Drosophila nasuta]|uniref:uncharacterized protein LOC132791027 isoform X1 n=2 Tax=Drosophila nasuta TaxID=42062 RepID=UPI00295F1647|nr:uncharacterized protein LOC132791027 isoform X1 [Drosophila nasuta]
MNRIEQIFPAKRCCYCLNLRTGCVFIALYGILCSGLNIDFIISIINDSPVAETKYVFTGELTGACQLAAEFLLLFSSIILLISTMVKFSFFVIVYLIIIVTQILYLLVYSIVSCAMKINILANYSKNVCIAYWLWVIFYCLTSLYFIYIAISYYKSKQTADINNDEPAPRN